MKNTAVRRHLAAGCAAAVALSTLLIATPASATDTGRETAGGWSEISGSFSDGSVPRAGTFASVSHRGTAESRVIGGTTNKRAHGWTKWAGTRHYTTAQLEHYWPASGVIATSGRKWGTGATEAVSPWKAFNPNAASNGNGAAKTYYGR